MQTGSTVDRVLAEARKGVRRYSPPGRGALVIDTRTEAQRADAMNRGRNGVRAGPPNPPAADQP